MACFLVPTAEAVVMTAINHNIKKKEEAKAAISVESGETGYVAEEPKKISWSKKISWLTNMLWGGALLLFFEHVWHGEVVFWPPFLTAMENGSDTAVMLHEMSTVGVAMALLVTTVWFIMTLVADGIYKKNHITVEATEK